MDSHVRRARWCFTTNNYTDDDIYRLRTLGNAISTNGYLLFGYEIAPQTGTRHLQGYVRFPQPRTFPWVVGELPLGSHIEQAKGTERANYRYCTKSNSFEEYGQQKSQGQRSDLEHAIHELLHERQPLQQVAENNPSVFVRNFRGLHELRNLLIPVKPRDFRSDVYIFIGPTRTGKSQAAKSLAGESTTYYKNRSNWWHGYRQESTVIIDDFYGWIKWDELLKICDRYPYKVETKGGYEEFTSQTIIITSNTPPETWYKFEGFDPKPLLSDRINAVIKMEETYHRIKYYNKHTEESDKIKLSKLLLNHYIPRLDLINVNVTRVIALKESLTAVFPNFSTYAAPTLVNSLKLPKL
ncbi:Rep [Mouse associated cyclovirus 1]|uniref:Replication-associated protein n=1 Tax=Mouse associated cyclovirus 1 TaxID=2169856 RepID=A0A1D8QQF0_9CIRC|nr:Rep [Mouse associated cyclovirus 1]AOW44153.1 Rep [Mouse associated cyclovirus 1]